MIEKLQDFTYFISESSESFPSPEVRSCEFSFHEKFIEPEL